MNDSGTRGGGGAPRGREARGLPGLAIPSLAIGGVAVAVALAGGIAEVAAAPPGSVGPARGGPPSMLVVSLDTFRADRLGVLGNSRGLTPNLDAFAADAVVFTQAWSQANITSMSHASLFTSRYPSELGTTDPRFHLGPAPPTLAEVLGVYDYDTVAFTAGGHLGRGFGLDRGFSRFSATEQLGSLWHTVPPALAWLDWRSRDRPFLLFVHGYDTHAPYLEPAPYGLAWAAPGYAGPGSEAVHSPFGSESIFDGALFRIPMMIGWLHERARPRVWDAAARSALAARAHAPDAVPFGPDDARFVADVYDGAAAYADALFGQLVAELKERQLYDDTVIVVLADHGESLGEAGRFGHGDSLSDPELHVPLLVHVPHGTPRRVDAPVTLLDVLPTLCELAGAQAPADIHGVSLVPWLHGAEGPRHDVVFAEGNGRAISARAAAGRLTLTGVTASSPYLGDLLRTAAVDGPAFTSDTTVADAAGREVLRGDLVAWRGSLAPVRGQTVADPAAVEAMRKQGYWAPK
jgi:arylsulfatase A-like enzyme